MAEHAVQVENRWRILKDAGVEEIDAGNIEPLKVFVLLLVLERLHETHSFLPLSIFDLRGRHLTTNSGKRFDVDVECCARRLSLRRIERLIDTT